MSHCLPFLLLPLLLLPAVSASAETEVPDGSYGQRHAPLMSMQDEPDPEDDPAGQGEAPDPSTDDDSPDGGSDAEDAESGEEGEADQIDEPADGETSESTQPSEGTPADGSTTEVAPAAGPAANPVDSAEPVAPQVPLPDRAADRAFQLGHQAIPIHQPPAGLPSLSARSCAGCHGEIFEQWEQTAHAQAFRSPLFQAAWQATDEAPECLHCHSPLLAQQPWEVSGYEEGDSQRPRRNDSAHWRPLLQTEGVTCAACHVESGTIVGPRPIPDTQTPHPVAVRSDLGSSERCAGCHDLSWEGAEGPHHSSYQTYSEWAESPAGLAGIGCTDCHMPTTLGNVGGNRFRNYASHEIQGGDHAGLLKRALTAELQLPRRVYQRGDTLRADLVLANTGAGHSVPTGSVGNRIEVEFRLDRMLAEGGMEEVASEFFVFERLVDSAPPYRERSDTRISAGESRRLRFSQALRDRAPAGRYKLIIVLTHRAGQADDLVAAGLDPNEHSVTFDRFEIDIEVR